MNANLKKSLVLMVLMGVIGFGGIGGVQTYFAQDIESIRSGYADNYTHVLVDKEKEPDLYELVRSREAQDKLTGTHPLEFQLGEEIHSPLGSKLLVVETSNKLIIYTTKK